MRGDVPSSLVVGPDAHRGRNTPAWSPGGIPVPWQITKELLAAAGRLSTLRNLSASLWADDAPAVDAAVAALTGLTALSLTTSHAWNFASLTQLRCRWGPARPPRARAGASRFAPPLCAMRLLAWSSAGWGRTVGRRLWLAPCPALPHPTPPSSRTSFATQQLTAAVRN